MQCFVTELTYNYVLHFEGAQTHTKNKRSEKQRRNESKGSEIRLEEQIFMLSGKLCLMESCINTVSAAAFVGSVSFKSDVLAVFEIDAENYSAVLCFFIGLVTLL